MFSSPFHFAHTPKNMNPLYVIALFRIGIPSMYCILLCWIWNSPWPVWSSQNCYTWHMLPNANFSHLNFQISFLVWAAAGCFYCFTYLIHKSKCVAFPFRSENWKVILKMERNVNIFKNWNRFKRIEKSVNNFFEKISFSLTVSSLEVHRTTYIYNGRTGTRNPIFR